MAWTDERLDDLSTRVDAGFERVDRDIRDLRAEMGVGFREVRGEIGSVRGELDRLRLSMVRLGGGMLIAQLGMIAALIARG